MARHNQSKNRTPKRVDLDLTAVMDVNQKFQFQRLINAILDDMQKQIREVYDDLTPIEIAPDHGINPPKAICLTIPNPRSEKYRDMFADPDQDKATDLDAKKEDVQAGFQPAKTKGKKENEAGFQPAKTKAKKENVKPGSQGGKASDPKTRKENIKANNTTTVEKPIWKAPTSPEDIAVMYQKTEKQILVNSVSELKRDTFAHFSKWRQNVSKRIQDIVIKNGGTSGNVGSQEPQKVAGSAGRRGELARGRPALQSGPSGKFFF